MDAPIPLKGVVLFIAFGTMIFIIVFCFVKRQITRFTLRSSSGPHALIGYDAPKPLAAEIERRLKWVKDVMCEPRLLQPGAEEKLLSQPNLDPCHYVYRMKAVDSVSLLDAEMKKFDPGIYRKPTVPMKTFLLEQRQVGPLEGTKLDLVERFSNAYEHARHDPKEFTADDYRQFMDLLIQLIAHIQNRCSSVDRSAAAAAVGTPQDQEKAGARSLTHGLQYRTPSGHNGASFVSGFDDKMISTECDTTFSPKSQRMANYALAKELSLKTNDHKPKQI